MADDLFSATPDQVQLMMWSLLSRLDDEGRARIALLADATESAGHRDLAALIRQALDDTAGLDRG